MPSPSPQDPGLFIRDPYHFSDAMLIVPPPLVECLRCFDGKHTDLDLRSMLARITGRLETEEIARNLVDTLAKAGFLEDGTFAQMQKEKRREFAEEPVRETRKRLGFEKIVFAEPVRLLDHALGRVAAGELEIEFMIDHRNRLGVR